MDREEELEEERSRLMRLRSLLSKNDQAMRFLDYGCGPYAVIPRRCVESLKYSSLLLLNCSDQRNGNLLS